jgi:hypothetical protein
LAAARTRVDEGARILGYRFTCDRISPPEKFISLRREFGDGFEGHEIPSEPGNPHGIRPKAHAVLTLEYSDEEDHPTRLALNRILEFLDENLRPQQAMDTNEKAVK